MRNIFLFIRKHSNFLFFLVLMGIAFYYFFRYNRYHNAAFMHVAHEATGVVYNKYNSVEDYFALKEENERLNKLITELQNKQPQNFSSHDTAVKIVNDTLVIDSVKQFRKYRYLEATVLSNSTLLPRNYITLNRGRAQGVLPEMAVIGPNGIVGVVIDVSDNYSKVMSLLNVDSKRGGMLLHSNIPGSIEWDEKNPDILLMKNVPKSAQVKKGDTVVTSNYAGLSFPPGKMIGTIDEIIPEKSTNNFLLKLKSSTNFRTIQHVWVIENLQAQEQKVLEQKTDKSKKM